MMGSALEDVLPLSPLQEGLLFHGIYDETATDVYLSQVGVDIDGELDVDRLHRAASALLTRHPTLRTGFRYERLSRPVQIIPRSVELPWQVIDLTGEPDAERRDARAAALAEDDLTRRFDLGAPPLVRFTVLRRAERRHRVLITFHHLLLDGWSVPIVLHELFELYAADGDAGALPPTVPYREFLEWLADRDQDAARTAWADALSGLDGPTLVTEPGACRRPTTPERSDLVLSEADSDRIRGVARANGLTLATVVQGVWGMVLARLTGRRDVVFGVTVSGRPPELDDVDSAVGFFINTIPVRVRIEPGDTVADLLRRAQAEQSRLLDHQHLGLADIQRAAGHGELFDTLTVLRNYPHAPTRLTDGTGAGRPDDGDRTDQAEQAQVEGIHGLDAVHYALGLVAVPGPALRFRLDHRPDLLSADYAELVATCVRHALDAVAAGGDVLVDHLDLLGPDRAAALLPAARGPEVPAPRGTLHDRVAERARHAPHHPAVVDAAGSVLTYSELDERATRLAAHLTARGVVPEQPVAVLAERSPELVVALVGVLRAGAAYVPLHTAHPAERLRRLVRELGITTVVTDAARAEQAAGLGPDPVRVDAVPEHAGPERAGAAGEPTVHPDQAAYVMYTSGSGGEPKGVVVTHRDVVAVAQDATWLPGSQDRVLMQAAPAFDASTTEVWPTLLAGGTLVVGPVGDLGPATLRGLVDAHGITAACLPTALYHVLSDEDPTCLAGLRQVWIGGESASPGAVRRVLEQCPDTVTTNVYGPTETTAYATAAHLHAPSDVADAVVPIGAPIGGRTVRLLDPALRPVLPGVAGEVHISGEGLARGYAGRPDRTGERFVADPFGAPGERMYRTGDLARMGGDGRLEFVGRTDDQVKIRGFRVEPAEVETALNRLPGVSHAVVLTRPDRRGDAALVAYLPDGVDAGAVRTALAAELADYQMPAAFVSVRSFPLTPNGKVDRAALPEPADHEFGGGEDGADTGRGPRTPQEEILCSLFADVLDVPPVGIDDNFFDLGGHSLLATRLVSRIRSVLAVELAMGQLFDSPTVAQLVAELARSVRGRVALARRVRPDRLPVSDAQRRLWFLHQLEGPSPTYTTAAALRLRGGLDLDAFRAALHDVMTRHETLRTVFADDQQGPVQIVLPPDEVAVPLTVEPCTEAELPAALESVGRRGFDLAAEVPLRAALFVLGPEEHVLLLGMHHIAGDAWSRRPLAEDLSAAYAARLAGRAPQQPELPVQYADYTLWQAEALGSEDDPDSALAAASRHWLAALEGLPDELALPTDRPRPPVPSGQGEVVHFDVPADLAAAVSGLARDCHATVFMVLQAAVATLMTRLGAGTDVPLGTPIAGRTDDALDDLIGFFVNTLVLRTDTSGDPTFRELVGRVRRADLAAYAHQEMPFERLVEELNPSRSLARNPLFQVLLTYDNTGRPGAAEPLHLPGLTITGVPLTAGVAKFDLAFAFSDQHAGPEPELTAVIEYNSDLFDRPTVDRMADWFLRVLREAVTAPKQRIGTIELLDLSTRHQVLERWNRVDDTARLTWPEVFGAQVAAASDRPAVESGDTTLTYAELDRAAARLARHLIAAGAGPDRPVGVMLPCSPEWVVALTAVLATGATYVPVDAENPADRIAWVLGDARPELVVTTTAAADLVPSGIPRVVLDDPATADRIARRPDGPVTDAERTRPLTVRDLAYVIYTSGSTGRPKGVEVEHTGLAPLVVEQGRSFGVSPGDRVLQLVSTSFDASLWDVFCALGNGATLVLPVGPRPLGPELAAYLVRHRISHVVTPPSVAADLPPDALPDGLTLTFTGEACPPQLAARFAGDRPVFNGYGPTEATIGSTVWRCDPGNTASSVPIGRPFRNWRLYVLDDRLQPVPPGVAGELYIAGAGLARGYRGRADLTSERFVADPHGAPGAPGARMYRTGDVGRWRADGVLDFMHRVDEQVKVRGFRVELREVEAALAAHPEVDQCLVVAVPGPRETSLAAYVVTPRRAVSTAELREHMGRSLPAFMVPPVVVPLDAFPLTVNGKIDRRALPAPVATAGPAVGRSPSTPREEVLCDLFAEVLGLDRVGIDDDFFQLGGHSLLVPRLTAAIRDALGDEVSIRDLFAGPTVAGLARRADAGADPFAVLLALRPGGDEPPLFCVHPGLGLGWCYSRLGRHLGPDQGVYTLQARGFVDGERPATDVDELVSDYCAQIRSVCPDGPVRLLGWSSGGLLAHRVASRLRDDGGTVDYLAIVDAYPREPGADTAADQEAALDGIGAEVGRDVRDLDAAAEVEVREQLQRTGHPLGQLPPGGLPAALRVLVNTIRLTNEIELGTFDGDVVLFRSAELAVDPPAALSPDAWSAHLTGHVEVTTLPAQHAELLTSPDSVALLGRTLDRQRTRAGRLSKVAGGS